MYLFSDGLLILGPEKSGLYTEYLFFQNFFSRIFVFLAIADQNSRIMLLNCLHDINTVILVRERNLMVFPGAGPPGKVEFPLVMPPQQSGEGGVDVNPANLIQRLKLKIAVLQINQIMVCQAQRTGLVQQAGRQFFLQLPQNICPACFTAHPAEGRMACGEENDIQAV